VLKVSAVTQDRIDATEGRYADTQAVWLERCKSFIAAQKRTELAGAACSAAIQRYNAAMADQATAGAAMQEGHEAHLLAARDRRELHEDVQRVARPSRLDAMLRR
jgi:hypothetical protein